MKKIFLITALIATAASAIAATHTVKLAELGQSMVSKPSYGALPDNLGSGDLFIINEPLYVVEVAGNVLFCRDNGPAAAAWSPTSDYVKQFYEGYFTDDEVHFYENYAKFTSYNWIIIEMPTGLTYSDWKDHAITGVRGTVNVTGSFDITMNVNAEQAQYFTQGDACTTKLNTYNLAHFNYVNGAAYNRNLHNTEPAFLVVPKPGEVALIIWAHYNGEAGSFDVPESSESTNVLNLTGKALVDWDFLYKDTGRVGHLNDGDVYNFETRGAVITTTGFGTDEVEQLAPRRAPSSNDIPDTYLVDYGIENYTIHPLEAPVQVVTAVTGVEAADVPVAVTYVSATGVVSATPHPGFNVEVKTLASGAQVTRKFFQGR